MTIFEKKISFELNQNNTSLTRSPRQTFNGLIYIVNANWDIDNTIFKSRNPGFGQCKHFHKNNVFGYQTVFQFC